MSLQRLRQGPGGGASGNFLLRLRSSAAGTEKESRANDYQHLIARVDTVRWRDETFGGMLPSYLAGKLPALGIEAPTPVQATSIETLLKGDTDVLMQAVTGAFPSKGSALRSFSLSLFIEPPTGWRRQPVVTVRRRELRSPSPRVVQARERPSPTSCHCLRGSTT